MMSIAALFAGPAFAQSFDNSQNRFVRDFIPGRVLAVTDFYTADGADAVRASHAVGQLGLCTGTYISPTAVLTAAHCIRGALGSGITIDVYTARDMAQETVTRIACERVLATAEYASGSDVAIVECAGTTGTSPPGLQFGYVAPLRQAPQPGAIVYSLWRNPVTDHPTLGTAGMSTLLSPGTIRVMGYGNSGAGPGFLNCSASATGQRRADPLDSQVMVTDIFAVTGASGSLTFDLAGGAVVGGPASAGNRETRVGVSMDATYGRGLPVGERMLFETLPPAEREPPARVPTRISFQDTQTGQEYAVLVHCIDPVQLHGLAEADSNGDYVHDVVLQELKWDWRQSHQMARFSDPLTAARWGLAADAIVPMPDGLTALPVGDSVLAQEHAGYTLILKAEQTVRLPQARSTLAAGQYRVTLDLGVLDAMQETEVMFGYVCGPDTGSFTATIPESMRSNRFLLGADLDIPCDAPVLDLTLIGGEPQGILVQSVALANLSQPLRFDLSEVRDMFMGTENRWALFTGDGAQPGEFALNVPGGSGVALPGVTLTPGVPHSVRLRARMLKGGQGTLHVGGTGLTLGLDWQDYAITVTPDAAAPFLMMSVLQNGAVALIDQISFGPPH